MVNITVTRSLDRRPISPLIYGINGYALENLAPGALAAFMQEIALPLRRWGGNKTSRYNYQNDISNHGSDWFFHNHQQASGSAPPVDSAANRFIQANQAAGVDSLIVVPTSGLAASAKEDAVGFSVAKYGPQDRVDPDFPDAGNGLRPEPDCSPIAGDWRDTCRSIGPGFVEDWVRFLGAQFGGAGAGGVRFYNLDNEPDLWFETHRDALPLAPGYDDLRDQAYAYGAAIKQADPDACVLGPVLGSYSTYWYSPKAKQAGKTTNAGDDDRKAHDGKAFLAWYLEQMAAWEAAHGWRLLDYLDVHYYPQGDGIYMAGARGEVGGPDVQAARLKSTRTLWDLAYTDDSWLKWDEETGGKVGLIRRLRQLVADHYPGTRIAISEYGWSALDDINGALAQADVLGIFGREGVDMAALYFGADFRPDDPGAYAFRMFRNYDGAGSQFGDVSVRADGANPDELAAFAAERSADDALTIMAINKTAAPVDIALAVSGPPAPYARPYQYGPADLNAIVRLPDLPAPAAGSAYNASLPPSSITLFELPAGH